MPDVPKILELNEGLSTYWNRGVIATADFITQLPDHTCALTKKGSDYIVTTFNSLTEEKH